MKELPLYQCHKRVKAAQIKGVTEGPRAGLLTFTDFEIEPVTVTLEFLAKHKPQPGWYFIVYEDGYQSASPAAAFEGGYHAVERA